ncbi:hypothetical protein AGMMS50239_29670 [Bacteroidia bacterium]|nr:hypothetical protein AGMMS50239_29670 [Bacteroidia bacterium]
MSDKSVEGTSVQSLKWKKETGYEVLFATSIDMTKFTFMLNNNAEKGTGKDTEKGTEKGTEKLSKNQQLIINEIINNPYITSENLSSIIGIRADKIRVNISKLKTLGLIERIGPDKGGSWKVLK